MDNNVVTAVAVGASAILGQLLTIWRERQRRKLDVRNRRWDAEDRERTAVERAKNLLGKLQENTDISVAAFKEANQVNLKLSAVHDRIDGVVSDTQAALERQSPK